MMQPIDPRVLAAAGDRPHAALAFGTRAERSGQGGFADALAQAGNARRWSSPPTQPTGWPVAASASATPTGSVSPMRCRRRRRRGGGTPSS